RSVAPPENAETLLPQNALQDALASQPLMLFHGQKRHAHTVLARLRKREAQGGTLAREELMRNLNQDAGAIAGFRITAARTPVRQADEDLDPLPDNVVRLVAFDTRDEAYTTGIVLKTGII